MPSFHRTPLCVLAALLLSACSREPALRDAVQHVDLGSALPEAAAADRANQELTDETPFPLAPDSGWRITYGTGSTLQDGGTSLLPKRRLGRYSAALSYGRADVQWSTYHAFELRARCSEPVTLRLHFKVLRPGGRVTSHALALDLSPSPEPRDQRIELGPESDWVGAIRSVELGFDGPTEAPLELHALRFVRRAWQVGYEPLGEDEAGARSTREIGLVTRERDCRRAFAADIGEALDAVVDVPQDGVLAVALSAADGLEPRSGPFLLKLEAAAAASPSEFSARGSVELQVDTLRDRWQLVHFPLADRAGERLRLRLTLQLAAGAAALPGAARTRILYGAPLVLGARPADARPNVLLVTLDTTRSDVAPRAGFTPNLDRLAERGLVFRNAFSTCNSTTASHASIHTGELLSKHGALDNLHLLPGTSRTLAESFRERGWHTAAAVSAEHLNTGTGFGQGFDEYWNAEAERHDGRSTTQGLLGYFDEWSKTPERPFFAWLHLFDAHTPYGPPPEELEAFAAARGVVLPPRTLPVATAPIYEHYPEVNAWAAGANNHAYLETLYRLGVAWADQALGLVLDDLARRGWLEHTLIIVTADHGEALGEHDNWYTHVSLHGEIVHVPLVVAGPGVSRAATIDTPASGLDIYPTLLRVAGAAVPAASLGVDLFDLAAGRTDPQRALHFQLERVQQSGCRTPAVHFIDTHANRIVRMTGTRLDEQGRRAPDFLTIEPGTALLYENASDPLQLHDLAPLQPEAVRAAREQLKAVDGVLDHPGARFRVVSPEQLDRLRQLGYVGGK
jgi:arylsulfatase A-like enzyme